MNSKKMYEKEKTPSPSRTFFGPLLASPPLKHLKYLHFMTEDEGTFRESWAGSC